MRVEAVGNGEVGRIGGRESEESSSSSVEIDHPDAIAAGAFAESGPGSRLVVLLECEHISWLRVYGKA